MALTIVKEAIDAGDLKAGGLITEGTAGSTGVLSEGSPGSYMEECIATCCRQCRQPLCLARALC